MSELVRSRRLVLVGAVGALSLAACGLLPSGPREVHVSQEQLAERIASQFPVRLRQLALFDVTLDQPRLRLMPEENRLGTEVNYQIAVWLPGVPDIKGKLEISYGLRFEPSDTTLRLTQARVERLDVDGLTAAQAAQVRKLGSVVTDDMLQDAVVHRLKKEDLETLSGKGYKPGAIRVLRDGLELQLDPIS